MAEVGAEKKEGVRLNNFAGAMNKGLGKLAVRGRGMEIK